MRTMLGQWWQAAGLPKLEQLTAVQAGLVLDEIARLEWEGRPFELSAHGPR